VVLKSNKLNKLINKFKENEILSKGSSAFIFKIIGSLLGYVFLLLVTRKSGAEVWGIFTLCLALLHITSIVSRCGIDISLVRYISEYLPNYSNIRKLFNKGVLLVSFFSILVSIFIYFLSEFIALFVFKNSDLVPLIKITSFAILPFSLSVIIAQSFRGIKEIKYFTFFLQPARYLFAIVLLHVLNYFQFFDSQFTPILSFSIGLLFVLLLAWFLFNKKISNHGNFSQVISFKELIKRSNPMMLSATIYLLITWIDTLMIGMYKTEAEVGIYNVAVRVSGLVSFGLAAVSSISAPKFSETYNNGDIINFEKIVHESSRLIFIFTLPIALLLVIFNSTILSLFGAEFVLAKNVLLILLVGQLFHAFSGSISLILQMTGNEKAYRNYIFIGLILNIILNVSLIPSFGIVGAAIASSCSLILWSVLSLVHIKKKFGFWTFHKIFSKFV